MYYRLDPFYVQLDGQSCLCKNVCLKVIWNVLWDYQVCQ